MEALIKSQIPSVDFRSHSVHIISPINWLLSDYLNVNVFIPPIRSTLQPLAEQIVFRIYCESKRSKAQIIRQQ